jgi:hypothetical protein
MGMTEEGVSAPTGLIRPSKEWRTQSAIGGLRLTPVRACKSTELLEDVGDRNVGELLGREGAWLKGAHAEAWKGRPAAGSKVGGRGIKGVPPRLIGVG